MSTNNQTVPERLYRLYLVFRNAGISTLVMSMMMALGAVLVRERILYFLAAMAAMLTIPVLLYAFYCKRKALAKYEEDVACDREKQIQPMRDVSKSVKQRLLLRYSIMQVPIAIFLLSISRNLMGVILGSIILLLGSFLFFLYWQGRKSDRA